MDAEGVSITSLGALLLIDEDFAGFVVSVRSSAGDARLPPLPDWATDHVPGTTPNRFCSNAEPMRSCVAASESSTKLSSSQKLPLMFLACGLFLLILSGHDLGRGDSLRIHLLTAPGLGRTSILGVFVLRF